MRRKIKYFILLFIVFSCFSLNAQPYKTAYYKIIDSLFAVFKKSNVDSVEINIIHKLDPYYSDLNNSEEARKYANQAITIAKEKGSKKLISITLRKLGNIYLKNLVYEKAIDYYLQALKFGEEANDLSLQGDCLNNLGNVYARLGSISNTESDYKKSLDFHLRAIEMRKKAGDNILIKNSQLNISNAYRGLGQQEKAIDYLLEAMKTYEKEKDNNGVDMAKNNLGETYLELAKRTGKMKYYDKAEEYFRERYLYGTATARKPNLLIHLGEVRLRKNNLNQAENYLLDGMKMAKENNAVDVLESGALLLAEIYQAQGDFKQSLKYHKLYSDLKDTLLDEHSEKQIAELNAKYESEKKEKDIELLTKDTALEEVEVNKQKLIRNGFIGGLAIVLLLAFLIYSRYVIKQKINISLSSKNDELIRKNDLIEKQKEKIIDSITYAQLIQQSILIEESEIQNHLPESFVYYQPKDIVSGDFYWFSNVNDKIIIAAVDCTGHGVPGAFMSMIGNTLLNQIVNEKHITRPSEILGRLNRGIIESMHQDKDGALSRDGMDISLCSIDYKNNQLEYAGAQNHLYMILDNEISVIKASPHTIGGGGLVSIMNNPLEREFKNHVIPIKKGMSIYLSTDGFMDQFGGPERKKFGTQKFKDLFLSSKHLSMQQQKQIAAAALENWKGSTQQIDDILVIGVRV